MSVIDGKYLSIEGLSHLWTELKQKFATAAQGTKADTAVQTIKINNVDQTKTNGVVTLDTYSKSETDSYVATAINALNVTEVGGTTRYIYKISQTDGVIAASSYASDATPTASSTKLVQSGGVKTYVDTAEANAKADWFLRGPIIATNTDFDTLTTPGHYYVNSNDSAITMTNIPVPYGGRLEVTATIGNTSYLKQTYYANTDKTGLICIRRQNTSGGSWSDWVILSTQNECGAIANLGAKNLSRAVFTSTSNSYGIAFTANADGTVTATGTATISVALQSATFTLKAGTYIFSSSENPKRDSTYDSYVYNVDTSTTIARDNPNDSPGTTFTLAQDATVRINLRIAKDYTVNNLVFKPMIRDAAITDATYQPPTLTNAELKEYTNTMLDTQCGAVANLGAKNMCPYNTFSATATSGSGATPVNDQPINLPAGTYILTYTQTATTGASSIRFSYNGTSVTNFTINNDSTLTKKREFTLASAANQIKVFSNAINNYSNFMIRPKAISDETYVPYGPTNAELNASKITMLNILGAGQRIDATSSATLDFDDAPFTSVGRFNWMSTATPYITNCPTYINGEKKGGVLETSLIQGPSTVLQTARPSAGADSPTIFWQRFRYGAGTTDNPYRWTSWYAFTGTEVQIPNAQTTNLVGGMRSVTQSLEESDIEPIEEPIEEER